MASCSRASGPQIPQFYAGQSVFITGASGFMGQVLLERLLTTCPDVTRLFVLLRRKKERSPEERLRLLKESQVFDNIRQKSPSQLDKLYVVSGDITRPKLGLDEDAVQLLNDVSVVFHSAATLKFDEPLGAAVEQNVKSVLRVMELCDTLPKMEVFVHVSTAYSNAERSVVEERVYPLPAPLHTLLALVETTPAAELARITPKIIYPKPNTYTFTKAMAEVAVTEHSATYPQAIFRPTIVVSSLRHPHPGWIQNLNGPSGVVAAAGKGALHVLRARPDAKADLLPADIAIDTLIATAWDAATNKSQHVPVYNCSTGSCPTTWRAFERGIRPHLRRHPLDDALWYPSGLAVQNRFVYKILEFLLHTLPLYLGEYAMSLLGMKTKISLITVSHRLQAMNTVLAFFSQREWKFETDNVDKLRRRLTDEDAAIFNLDPSTIDWEEHCKNFVKGVRKYLLKEKDEDLDKARRHIHKLHILHNIMLAVVFFLVFRFFIKALVFTKMIGASAEYFKLF